LAMGTKRQSHFRRDGNPNVVFFTMVGRAIVRRAFFMFWL
jgi:hypothetical protein